jgi:hypothetical protein
VDHRRCLTRTSRDAWLCPASSSRGGLPGMAGVTTRPAGYPSGGVPPAVERQLHLLAAWCRHSGGGGGGGGGSGVGRRRRGYVNPTQVYVNPTQVCVNPTQVCVHPTQARTVPAPHRRSTRRETQAPMPPPSPPAATSPVPRAAWGRVGRITWPWWCMVTPRPRPRPHPHQPLPRGTRRRRRRRRSSCREAGARSPASPSVRPTTRERERERVHRVGSHGRWKRPCLQTAHMTI